MFAVKKQSQIRAELDVVGQPELENVKCLMLFAQCSLCPWLQSLLPGLELPYPTAW